MKAKMSFFSSSLIIAMMLMTFHLSGFSQATDGPDILLKFTRQANGKIATTNASGQKVFEFKVSGLATQADVDKFKSNFLGKRYVVSMAIGESKAGADRSGSIVFTAGTKTSYAIELLVKAGISTISIDGTLTSVNDLLNSDPDASTPGTR